MHSLALVRPRELIKTKPIFRNGIEIQKSRSFLVISSPLVQQNSECCVCVGITSSETEGLYLIPLRQKDIEGGELDYEQQIDCKKLITLYKNQVLEKIGIKITKELYKKVIEKLKDVIDSNPT